jgi:hypothetical protein
MFEPTPALPESHGLARAFLALADDPLPAPAQRSSTRAVAALVAAIVLCIAAPLSWMAPASRSLTKLSDQPAATLANSKALLHPDEDENDA